MKNKPDQAPHPKGFLSAKKAQEILGVSRATLSRMHDRGEVAGVTVKGRVVFEAASVEEARARRVAQPPRTGPKSDREFSYPVLGMFDAHTDEIGIEEGLRLCEEHPEIFKVTSLIISYRIELGVTDLSKLGGARKLIEKNPLLRYLSETGGNSQD